MTLAGLLYRLLSLVAALPVPPPASDLTLFPPRCCVQEVRRNYRAHVAWCERQAAYAANDVERRAWQEYLDSWRDAGRAWDALDECHAWRQVADSEYEGDRRVALYRGEYVPYRQMPRLLLADLRELLGPANYYGGCLPLLPQWPRAERETVPMPAAR